MPIQKVQNQNITFKSNRIENAENFVCMNDEQLKLLAYTKPQSPQKRQENHNSIMKTLWAIPIVDSIATGILAGEKGSLGSKAFNAGAKATNWGVSLGLIGLYLAIKNAIVRKSETLQNFEQRNPLMSFIADIGVITAGFSLGSKALNKFTAKQDAKNPEIIAKGTKKLNKIIDKIDKTKLNKKVLPKITELVTKVTKKVSWAKPVGEFALKKSPFILLGIAAVKMLKQSADRNKEVKQTYKELKEVQRKTGQDLVKILHAERGLLAQEDPKYAYELRQALNAELN